MTARSELEAAKASVTRLEKRLDERHQRDLKRLIRWAQRTSASLERAEREPGGAR